MILLNPAMKKTHFSAFLNFWSLKRVGGIIFFQFFSQNKKIQTFENTNVDMSSHFDIDIGKNEFF